MFGACLKSIYMYWMKCDKACSCLTAIGSSATVILCMMCMAIKAGAVGADAIQEASRLSRKTSTQFKLLIDIIDIIPIIPGMICSSTFSGWQSTFIHDH